MNRRPPKFAGLLLRILHLGDRRAEVEEDLLELFLLRAQNHGERYARRRYYGDVLSLWRRSGMQVHPRQSPNGNPSIGKRQLRETGQDLAYAARLFRRSPGVVAVTIAGLGLAIGVSTSVFSLLNAIALQSGGIEDPATAVHVLRALDKGGISTAWRYSEYLQLRSTPTGVTLEASLPQRQSFPIAAESDSRDMASVMFVSGGYLEALSRRVTLGRLLTPADDRIGVAPAAVVSHGFWARRLGKDPAIVGRALRWNGVEVTVVGVTDRRFTGATDSPPDFWAPIAAYQAVFGGPAFNGNTVATIVMIGRVHPDVTLAEAEARLGAGATGLTFGSDQLPRARGVRFVPAGGQGLNRDFKGARTMALVVAMAVIVIGLVLVLACVNVANLLLASAISRQREIGVRLALGASRGRLMRQLLTESLSLGLVGGAVGLMLTIVMVPLLAAFTRVPVSLDVTPDIRVYGFLVAVSIVAGLGAGLTPARHASRGDLVSPLKGVVASGEVTARPARFRSTLVAVQAAASIVLVVLAALLTRGMIRATQVDVGFDAHRLLTTSPLFVRGTQDAAGAKAYWDLALERVQALPGVRSAALAEFAPFGNARRGFRGGADTIYQNDTRADYFATLGLRVIRGRTYTAEEVAGRAQVAVISASLAQRLFPGEDPIGQSLDRIVRDSHRVIIGVVSDAITDRLRQPSAAIIYQPLEDARAGRMLIRSDVALDTVIPSVRNALHEIDPRVRLDIKLVSDGLQQELDESRTLASLASALAALALAVVGLYGVTAFVVGQRTQEISVRVALGATGRDIMRLLLGDSLRPVIFGLAAGVFAALLGNRVLASLLYGVRSTDPIAFGVAVLVLLTAAVMAVIVPTRRAAAVDPAAVLRQL